MEFTSAGYGWNTGYMNRLVSRFPGVRDGWARFDGPAGTQMVDTAIAAMTEWASNGSNANCGGSFEGAVACDALLEATRSTVGQLLGSQPEQIVFGANMTTMTLAFTQAVASTLQPGDRVVGTMLDHSANVTPWQMACTASGADHVLAPFDRSTGLLDPEAVIDLIDERTSWVAVTGASNLLGTAVDLPPIIVAAHAVGARVYVDAVHLAPHRAIDVATLGADALVTSPYKWYGPHAGVLCLSPAVIDDMPIARIRPAASTGTRKWESGTPNFESIAAIGAAAQFLLDEGVARIAAEEAAVCAPLLLGLAAITGVKVWGAPTMSGRVPTVSFTVDGVHPDDVSAALALQRIATWAGHSYAMDAVDHLGLAESGGVVRAGVVAYIDGDDVDRLVNAVASIAGE